MKEDANLRVDVTQELESDPSIDASRIKSSLNGSGTVAAVASGIERLREGESSTSALPVRCRALH